MDESNWKTVVSDSWLVARKNKSRSFLRHHADEDLFYGGRDRGVSSDSRFFTA